MYFRKDCFLARSNVRKGRFPLPLTLNAPNINILFGAFQPLHKHTHTHNDLGRSLGNLEKSVSLLLSNLESFIPEMAKTLVIAISEVPPNLVKGKIIDLEKN